MKVPLVPGQVFDRTFRQETCRFPSAIPKHQEFLLLAFRSWPHPIEVTPGTNRAVEIWQWLGFNRRRVPERSMAKQGMAYGVRRRWNSQAKNPVLIQPHRALNIAVEEVIRRNMFFFVGQRGVPGESKNGEPFDAVPHGIPFLSELGHPCHSPLVFLYQVGDFAGEEAPPPPQDPLSESGKIQGFSHALFEVGSWGLPSVYNSGYVPRRTNLQTNSITN
jgi:hypothetical protein